MWYSLFRIDCLGVRIEGVTWGIDVGLQGGRSGEKYKFARKRSMEGECQWFGEDLPEEGPGPWGGVSRMSEFRREWGALKVEFPRWTQGCQELKVPPFCSYALEAELSTLQKGSRPRPRSGSRTKPSIRYRPRSGSTKGCRKPPRDPQ